MSFGVGGWSASGHILGGWPRFSEWNDANPADHGMPIFTYFAPTWRNGFALCVVRQPDAGRFSVVFDWAFAISDGG